MDIFVLKKTLMLWSDENGRIDLNSFVNRFFVLLEKNQDNEAMKTDIEKRKKQVTTTMDIVMRNFFLLLLKN